ncbi:MAG TPA: transposase [Blastocatellia bacterium]|nr:transposase [Blastocatellia bacterium]
MKWQLYIDRLNAEILPGQAEEEERKAHERSARLERGLARIPPDERDRWISELNRLAAIIERFDSLSPKQTKHPSSGELVFTKAVFELCREAACTDQVILARTPSRGAPPSPHTLTRWLRSYREDGLIAFLRSHSTAPIDKPDRRKVRLCKEAADFINSNWRTRRSPKTLYECVRDKAEQEGWAIPSYKWFQRQYRKIPRIIYSLVFKGEKHYQSNFAPYVPRDASDLGALQLLCGDHKQSDVSVLWRDGKTLLRPWITLWQDVRTGLIWGWHVDVTPSSATIGRAYARGVRDFGAQPPARPETGYKSYVYTDNGRDYRSRHMNGKIEVHHKAASLKGGIEFIRRHEHIGLFNDTDVEQVFARARNAKEKPVERTNADIARWEMNTFEEWCGNSTDTRPDKWRKLYEQHLKANKGKGRVKESPFIGFDEYVEALAGFIRDYNHKEHTRSVLGGATVVPIEEFQRLYTTPYTIKEETLALILMKAERKTIGKLGVGCSAGASSWRWQHPAMSIYKGKRVEVRYDPNDLRTVWVVLPDGNLCEASYFPQSGYLTPNKQTADLVRSTIKREKNMEKTYRLALESQLRGESVEERLQLTHDIKPVEADEREQEEAIGAERGASVTLLTKYDRPKERAALKPRVTAEDVAKVVMDESFFEVEEPVRPLINLDYDLGQD